MCKPLAGPQEASRDRVRAPSPADVAAAKFFPPVLKVKPLPRKESSSIWGPPVTGREEEKLPKA